MSNPSFPVHHTIIRQLTGTDGEGWEFHCADCGFLTRYYLPGCTPDAQLEIISLGDASARHLSEVLSLGDSRDEFVEEEWLTPEIRQTIQRIVQKLDD